MVTYSVEIDDKTVLGLLVARVAGGDRAAFRRLYARLHTAVCDHVDGSYPGAPTSQRW